MREFLHARTSSNAYVLGLTMLWLSNGHPGLLFRLVEYAGSALFLYGVWLDWGLAGWWGRRKSRPHG